MATVVATTASSVATEPQRWAVSLNMAKALTMVALLGLGSARQRATVGLVAGLLAYTKTTWLVGGKKKRGGERVGGERKEKRHDHDMGHRTVIAETLSRGADLGIVAHVATFVASTSGKRRHFDYIRCLKVRPG